MFSPLYWDRIKIIIGSACATTVIACSSPKSMIDDGAIYITDKANETKLIAEEIKVISTDDSIVNKSDVIVELQSDIITATSTIRTNLHGVEDTTPTWMRIASQFSVALIIIGIIVLLWQTGIGLFIKKLFWSMGLFIPKRVIQSAEVDFKALDETNPLTYRESVAVRRASDPAYEYAMKRVRNRS
ncbi:MAG: hypothetical protein Unbinned97contig1000_39 [Prokaryotic dsDNA virus sp.]|nr:MAG: hypothetical protein Unbinned97contig1000_39 [Prokaryotic dsDNA virus sp.]|tara:strand:+ start:5 stop:562 length:558 start_codon:yes stop_codon:yes gene_type:complete